MFFEGNNRIYLAGPAVMLGELPKGVEIASSEWAAKYIVDNEANSYVLGRFVEADKANNNKQYFRLGDLLMAQPTISYAPLNINHQSSPIGTFVASEMQYPKNEEDNPYIEALSAVWKHYFPEAFALVQRAYAEQNLFYSMEAVPRSLSTIGGSDDSAEYAYMGRIDDSYPEEINKRTCDGIILNSPHFVGGALVVPPSKPGWSKADIKQMSIFMKQQWETAEQIYSDVQAMAPDAGAEVWETLFLQFLAVSMDEANKLKAKNGKSDLGK